MTQVQTIRLNSPPCPAGAIVHRADSMYLHTHIARGATFSNRYTVHRSPPTNTTHWSYLHTVVGWSLQSLACLRTSDRFCRLRRHCELVLKLLWEWSRTVGSFAVLQIFAPHQIQLACARCDRIPAPARHRCELTGGETWGRVFLPQEEKDSTGTK